MRLSTILFCLFGGFLTACSESPDTNTDLSPSAAFDESTDPDPELGKVSIQLPGDDIESDGYCSIDMTRARDKSLVTVFVKISVEGTRCFDVNCEDEVWHSGEVLINLGQEKGAAAQLSVFNYEPVTPKIDEDSAMWMLDNESPAGEMQFAVGGTLFDPLLSDDRGTDSFAEGPHLWPIELVAQANMMKSSDNGPLKKAEGKLSYVGLCQTSMKYINL